MRCARQSVLHDLFSFLALSDGGGHISCVEAERVI